MVTPGTIKDSVNAVQNFIDLASYLKKYMTPQYKAAAIATYKIIDNFLLINQSMLRWVHAFEILNLTEERKDEFLKFYKEYQDFRSGPEFQKLTILTAQVISIYETMLGSSPRKWFSKDKKKLLQAENIFHSIELGEGDDTRYVHDLLGGLMIAINLIKADYDQGRQIQREFLDHVKWSRGEILKQTDQLSMLLRDYLKLSGAILSV